MVHKNSVTKRKGEDGSDQGASSSGTPHSPQSNSRKQQKKLTGKQKRMSKQAAQEQVQSSIRNKMLFAVIGYIVIGGLAVYWFGLPKPKDLPPEVEAEILGSYPHEVSKSNIPKGFYKDENGALAEITSKEDTKTEDDEAKEEKAKENVQNVAGGIGAEAVEVHSDFKEHFQKKFSLKSRNGYKWKKLKITKNNSSTKVQMYIMDNFLSELECNGLMRAHIRHVNTHQNQDPITCFSGVESLRQHLHEHGFKKMSRKMSELDFIPGTNCLNGTLSSYVGKNLPWSYSTSFYPGESKFSTEFDRRVSDTTGLDARNGGKFQVTSYAHGVGYKGHHDCTVDNPDKRDRFATILVYLQDVEDGGETVFPELGVKVRPKKGRALLWNNMNSDGNCDPFSFHKAAIVNSGRKYILQRWYYYQNFPTLGKRMPQPALPKRNELTARVSCDEYQFGSCRWYDEWNYDHLTSYNNAKHTLR